MVLLEKQIKNIYLWEYAPPEPDDIWYSDDNYAEFQDLVNSIWSVQFVDSWKRYRFNNACYIWNRRAVNVNGSTFSVVDIDNLSVVSSTSTTANDRIWYFWDNRILTRVWILDFQGNVVTSFSTNFNSVCLWLPWVVWASDSSYNIYKWTVDWDNISFTKVGTWWTDQSVWGMYYGRLWAYLINQNDTSWSWYCTYVNPSTSWLTNFQYTTDWRWASAIAGADWKLYRLISRDWCFGKFQKIWTWSEWTVWDCLSTNWTQYWLRVWKFLWNIVSWWMNSSNGTGNWYWSNNYFVNTSWTLSKVQTNAFAYDTNVNWFYWFIDENWWLYPTTYWWWSGVILKTDKTFTDLPWRNPYLWR